MFYQYNIRFLRINTMLAILIMLRDVYLNIIMVKDNIHLQTSPMDFKKAKVKIKLLQ